MGRSRPIGWLSQVIRPSRLSDSVGIDAARRLIAGDVDGAIAAAEIGRAASNRLARSDAYAVLAWGHLIRGERSEAEAAATIARQMRTPDPLLIIALVVASGGPSAGSAIAFARAAGILSMVGTTRVLETNGRFDEARAEIAAAPPTIERAALRSLLVGLVALDRQDPVDAVVDRLAVLGQTADRYAASATALSDQGLPTLAAAFRQLAVGRGLEAPVGDRADAPGSH